MKTTPEQDLDRTIKNICLHHRRTRQSPTERQLTRAHITTAMQPLLARGVDVVRIAFKLVQVWAALSEPRQARERAAWIATARGTPPTLRQVGLKGRQYFGASDRASFDNWLKQTELYKKKFAPLDWNERFFQDNLAAFYTAVMEKRDRGKPYEAMRVRSWLTMALLDCTEYKEEWAGALAAAFPRKWRSPAQVKQDIKNAVTRHQR